MLRHVADVQPVTPEPAGASSAGQATPAPGEIVALELREGLGALGEVTGRTLGGDILERIFSRFCVGK